MRTADFGGRSQRVKKAIEQFKAYGEYAPLEHYLPAGLAQVPRSQLRVCEAAVQSQYVRWTPVVGISPVLDKIESIVLSIGEFGRMHSLSSHEAYAYLLKYKGIDYLDKYHTIGSCAPIESIVEDLSKVCCNNGGLEDRTLSRGASLSLRHALRRAGNKVPHIRHVTLGRIAWEAS